MKRILPLFIVLSSFILANIKTVVSIVPEATFVKAIGKERVDVTVMVAPGSSPHTYEPKPSQMRAVANAQLYFAIGVEFENAWLPRFRDLNPKMQVIDLSQGIAKLPMKEEAHEEHDSDHEADVHHHGEMDPHIWTDPKNVTVIARHICDALIAQDSTNAEFYKANLDVFLAKVRQTDATNRKILSTVPKGSAFMVFHPSWGYFANAYGLVQLPVEVEGKKPKPRELIALIKKARQAKVQAIFTQPEFSDASAKIIANELNIPVIKVSPLAADWSENLIRIAKAIAGVR